MARLWLLILRTSLIPISILSKCGVLAIPNTRSYRKILPLAHLPSSSSLISSSALSHDTPFPLFQWPN
jgi:hypothetical protein